MKEHVRVFVRLRPSMDGSPECHASNIPALKAATTLFDIVENPNSDEASETCNSSRESARQILKITVPRPAAADGTTSHYRDKFQFQFDKIFAVSCFQNDLFENVASPLVDRALEGYNGTLFAYGQTGSGKTFTITGPLTGCTSAHCVSSRHGTHADCQHGIIPRTLSCIFDRIRSAPETSSTISISYLEIYNECGYDLLHPLWATAGLSCVTADELGLPKVTLLEDGDQNVHVGNLSMHTVETAVEAMRLLEIGQVNRARADTPVNPTSTRSHCIFTVIIKRHERDSALVKMAKFHIVDLAGSERVWKNGIGGKCLTEAKHINLSLHHLEQVIGALSEKNRRHIPYRNSLLTSILKDSLGGNCLTSMIATCSTDACNIEESVSTCRFSQRVSLIKNQVVANQDLDRTMELQLLRKQLADLKNSYALLLHAFQRIQGGCGKGSDLEHWSGCATEAVVTERLSQEEKDTCRRAVEEFVAAGIGCCDGIDKEDELILPDFDWRKIQFSFGILRGLVLKAPNIDESSVADKVSLDAKKIEDLEQTLLQRDRELAVLCKLLRQEKKRMDKLVEETRGTSSGIRQSSSKVTSDNERALLENNPAMIGALPIVTATTVSCNMEVSPNSTNSNFDSWPQFLPVDLISRLKSAIANQTVAGDSDLRRNVLISFLQSYPERSHLEQLKLSLTSRIDQARHLGTGIRELQNQMPGSCDDSASRPSFSDRQETALKQVRLKAMLGQLRTLKSEVEVLESEIKTKSGRIQEEFDCWWNHLIAATV